MFLKDTVVVVFGVLLSKIQGGWKDRHHFLRKHSHRPFLEKKYNYSELSEVKLDDRWVYTRVYGL